MVPSPAERMPSSECRPDLGDVGPSLPLSLLRRRGNSGPGSGSGSGGDVAGTPTAMSAALAAASTGSETKSPVQPAWVSHDAAPTGGPTISESARQDMANPNHRIRSWESASRSVIVASVTLHVAAKSPDNARTTWYAHMLVVKASTADGSTVPVAVTRSSRLRPHASDSCPRVRLDTSAKRPLIDSVTAATVMTLSPKAAA
mmetsp:Transcript_20668/g.53713  ORF Transcript_20668/g.53713 Transcript_20668/m.53713 type:complete len:202 (+) Transcript_20668:469-1074(+)